MPELNSDPAAGAEALDAQESIQHVDAPEAQGAPTEAFDWTPHAEHLVTVKVKGEELQVPLREALAGYSRQADYTRDNQALSQRAQAVEYAESLAAALERNPQATLAYLQDFYGAAPEGEPAGAEELDPWQQRVDSFISQQETAARDAAVQRELEAVKSQFDGIDEAAVLQHAIKTNLPLMAAAKDMMFDDVYAEAEAVRQARAAREASEAEATEAKRAAAGLVAGGHGTNPNAVASGVSSKPSLREAFAASVRQHG